MTDMPKKRKLLETKPQVISLGLDVFADSLADLGIEVVQVDWRPPAGGDPRMVDLLDRLRQGHVPEAGDDPDDRL